MTFDSSGIVKLKQSLCHWRQCAFLFAVPSCACPMYFLQSLRTFLFQVGRLYPVDCIQIYKYMYGKVI